MGSPLEVADLRVRVQAALDAEIGAQALVLAEIGTDLGSLVDAVRDLLRGGKRLRAAFLYWGYRAGGRPDSQALVRAAAAMECFQAAALLHDDVMDDSGTRRGRPSAHRALAEDHERRGWSGDAARFGVAGAILAGDLCLTWTDEMYATSGLPAADLARGRSCFDRMRTQLMGGQFLDVLESARGWGSQPTPERIARARNVIRFKSAKYTVEHPLLIGATAAGVPAADLAALSAYGLDLGEAFQLRDDLLGVFGDPVETGKPAGDDLREGKRTVLLAHALDVASAEEAATIDRLLGAPDLDEAGVEALRHVIRCTGAVERVEKLIAALAGTSREALHRTTTLDADALSVLDRLVDAATDRSS